MAGILFWHEDTDVFSGRQINVDAWMYAMNAGGITKARCVNKTTEHIHMGDNDFKVIGNCVEDFLEWCDAHREEVLVFIETENSCPPSAIPLTYLDHSKVDWYVFGSGSGFPKSFLDDKQCVFLPTHNGIMLHPLHIGSCVMLRRYEELEWQSH